MPTFIVHHKSDVPKFATIDDPVITIGRDPACSVVLPGRTVSRQHVRIRLYQGGVYMVDGVKPENPVILNGRFVREAVALEEGTELQIADYLVIFSLDRRARDIYLSEHKFYEGVCSACQWNGQIGSQNRQPMCPRCGKPIVERKDDLTGTGVPAMTDQGETSYLGAIDVAKIHDQLKQATRAKLRPAGGRGTEVKLSRDTPCTIGKAGKCTIPVSGLLLGGTATIRFEGEAWIASFDGLVSGLSVNGSKVRQVALQPGDLVRVGSGEYRFIID